MDLRSSPGTGAATAAATPMQKPGGPVTAAEKRISGVRGKARSEKSEVG